MEEGLKSKVDKIYEWIESQESKRRRGKDFRLPFGVRLKERRLAKQGKVLVFLLRTNKALTVETARIENGMIALDKYNPKQCTTDFIYLYRGKVPCIVLPEWSLTPIGTKDYYDAVADKRVSDPQSIIIRQVESAQAGAFKKKLSPQALVIGVIVVGILIFVLTQ